MGSLTVAKIEARKKPGRLSDGNNLVLKIGSATSKSWLFVYQMNGKRKSMGLGGYPLIGLAEARAKVTKLRGLVAQNIDPKAERDRSASEAVSAASKKVAFGAYAEHVLPHLTQDFKNKKHIAQWFSTVRTYAKPIWHTPIDEVTVDHIAACIRPVWKDRHETAVRTLGRIEAIFEDAIGEDILDGDNPARMSAKLRKRLGPGSKSETKHHPAMAYEDVPGFYARLVERDALSAACLRFLVLTATRQSEARGARWSEIDLKARVWTIPGTRMKKGREHQVPLSDEAVTLLKELEDIHGDGTFVFPSDNADGFISETSLRQLRQRMISVGDTGSGWTMHGFRSSFRDFLGNETDVPRELAELSLAHKVGDPTERAYRRKTAVERRRQVMQVWADHVMGKRADNMVRLVG